MTRIVTILALVLLIPGGSVAQRDADERATVEELFGIRANVQGITFQVSSGGCTSESNFRIEVFHADTVQLVLLRVVPDYCEAYFPYGTNVFFSWESMGLTDDQTVIVRNPRRPIRVHTH
jgi:hypothetical protein